MLDIIPGYGRSEEEVAAAIAAAHDPTTTLDEYDDFISGSNSTGFIGKLGWVFANGTATFQASEANRPGIIRRDTGASSVTASMAVRQGTALDLLPSAMFDARYHLFYRNLRVISRKRTYPLDIVTVLASESG